MLCGRNALYMLLRLLGCEVPYTQIEAQRTHRAKGKQPIRLVFCCAVIGPAAGGL